MNKPTTSNKDVELRRRAHLRPNKRGEANIAWQTPLSKHDLYAHIMSDEA